jgi:hypothetical protein
MNILTYDVTLHYLACFFLLRIYIYQRSRITYTCTVKLGRREHQTMFLI